MGAWAVRHLDDVLDAQERFTERRRARPTGVPDPRPAAVLTGR
ncbi:hypothetical protein [Planomonospora alba]